MISLVATALRHAIRTGHWAHTTSLQLLLPLFILRHHHLLACSPPRRATASPVAPISLLPFPLLPPPQLALLPLSELHPASWRRAFGTWCRAPPPLLAASLIYQADEAGGWGFASVAFSTADFPPLRGRPGVPACGALGRGERDKAKWHAGILRFLSLELAMEKCA
ncbi:hypothetical protein SEVIR_3G028933v4 [Setaria viridis]